MENLRKFIKNIQVKSRSIRTWDGQKLFTFDLTQNPKYWVKELNDGIISYGSGELNYAGIEFFEGDIVSYNKNGEQPKIVVLQGGRFGTIDQRNGEFQYLSRYLYIIGNIFEEHKKQQETLPF